MAKTNYIFGYGSLVSAKDIERTLGHPPLKLKQCTLQGWTRDWGVILDNTTTNRRYELLPVHEVPKYVAILNIRLPKLGEQPTNPNGVLFSVSDEEIAKMDERENHYKRTNVTKYIDGNIDGNIYAYVSLEQFLGNASLETRAILPKSYYDLVKEGFRSFSDESLEKFLNTTLPTNFKIAPTIHASSF